MSYLEDLKSWTRRNWFRRGVIEENRRYVEGRDGVGQSYDGEGETEILETCGRCGTRW